MTVIRSDVKVTGRGGQYPAASTIDPEGNVKLSYQPSGSLRYDEERDPVPA